MTGIVKKLLGSVMTILVVSCLVFLAFAVIPGDPAVARLGVNATPDSLAQLRASMGLDRPLGIRIGEWIGGALKGDFGISYSYNIPVSDMIKDKLPVTLILSLYSMLLMIALSISAAVFAAYHEGSATDRVIQIVNQIVMSIPPFFSGIIITLTFGMGFKLFTPGGYVSYQNNPVGFLIYMFFPALSIALPKAAMAFGLLYSSLVEEGKKDYARTAYSRGNDSKGVFFNHLLKNASIPVITFLGIAMGDMIAGSIVIEQVFGIPGLGRILLTSIQNRDYPVVVAIIVIIAILVIVSNLLVDLLYRIVDPRIR